MSDSLPKDGCLIAIVDDEPALRMVFSLALKTAGYEAVTFKGGMEFLSYPDIESIKAIIVDLRMPGIDGLSMLGQLYEKKRSIPAILCSANITSEIEEQAAGLGVTTLLHKPVPAQKLRDAVAQTLTGRMPSGY